MPTPPRSDTAQEATADLPGTAEHLMLPQIRIPQIAGLGDLHISSEIGRGAKGVVYKAHNSRASSVVYAIKIINESSDISGMRGDLEGSIATRIRHDGVVRVYNFDLLPNGQPYIVMDYLEGETLRDYLNRHPILHPKFVLHLIRKLADAMSAVHACGLVHRDIKPSNIMLVKKETDSDFIRMPVVLDFGLAQRIRQTHETLESRFQGFVGTPKYVAPEQWHKHYVDGKADVYSLGVLFYEMLVGRPPFVAHKEGEYAELHQFKRPIHIQQRDSLLDNDIAALVMRTLAREPTERPSMEEVKREVERLLPRPTWVGGLSNELCPFPGLNPYSSAMSCFFSRPDTDLVSLVSTLGRHDGASPWLHLEGPALSGKTSLVQAGLVPLIIQHSQQTLSEIKILSLKGDGDPLMRLAEALVTGHSDSKTDAKDLAQLIRENPEKVSQFFTAWKIECPNYQFILILDGLEEMLDSDAQSLRCLDAALLNALNRSEGDFYLITLIRSEHAARFGRLAELLSRGPRPVRHILQPLDSDSLKEVIMQATSETGLQFDKGLLDDISHDALASTVGLSAVGYTLKALWLRRESKELLRTAYNQIGPVSIALSRAADATLNLLINEDERSRARRLLVGLIRCGRGESDLPRSVRWENAVHIAGGGKAGEKLLSALLHPTSVAGEAPQLRLPLLQQQKSFAGETTVRLASWALVHAWPTMRDWTEEDRPILERWDDIEAAAIRSSANPAVPFPRGEYLAYLRGAGLSSEQAQRLSSLLSPATQRFLDEAAKSHEQEKHSSADELTRAVKRVEEQRTIIEQEVRQLRQDFSVKEKNYLAQLNTLQAIRRSSLRYVIIGGIVGLAAGLIVSHITIAYFGRNLLQYMAKLLIADKSPPIATPPIPPEDKRQHPVPPPPPPPPEKTPVELGMQRILSGKKVALIGQRSFSVSNPSGLWMDVTEVTVGEYKLCLKAGGCQYNPAELPPLIHPKCNLDRRNGDGVVEQTDTTNHPMNCVTAAEAEAYCRFAKKRLPTMDEWMFAARGGSQWLYPWGPAPLSDQPCWGEYNGTCPVGSHPKDISPFGILDMAGNVAEWTATKSSRIALSGQPLRQFAGGNWANREGEKLNLTAEHLLDPTIPQTTIGFRCIQEYHLGDEDKLAK